LAVVQVVVAVVVQIAVEQVVLVAAEQIVTELVAAGLAEHVAEQQVANVVLAGIAVETGIVHFDFLGYGYLHDYHHDSLDFCYLGSVGIEFEFVAVQVVDSSLEKIGQ